MNETAISKAGKALSYMLAGIGLLYVLQLSNIINMVVPSPDMTIGQHEQLARRK